MRAVTIARLALVRLLRERSNLFFVFVFPLALVLLIGLQFGNGGDRTLAAVIPDGDTTAAAVVADLEDVPDLAVERTDGRAAAVDAVATGRAHAAVVLPPGFDDAVSGEGAAAEFLTRPGGTGIELRPVVAEVVSRHSVAVTAAAIAAELTGRPGAEMVEVARGVAGLARAVEIEEVTVSGDPLAAEFAGLNQFAVGASSQLVLFVFITSLIGASRLIEERTLGVTRRILSTPTRTREVLLGAAGGRFAVAAFQGLYIAVGSLVIFGVQWGDPLGAGLVLVVFSAVSAGAAVLLGATVDNDAQAGGVGIGLGLGLAALGGSMAPLEVFPETMRTVAHVTPHAWANDAFADLIRRDGTVVDILPELAVLTGMAVVLLGVGIRRLRDTITG